MSSYNRVNGPFTQENRELLTTILRDEWRGDGIVMTDWTGLCNTAAQIQAGNDLLKPGQSETLTMTVTNYDLASYNEATQSWEAPAGKYTLGFAANVEDIRTTAVYSLPKMQPTKCHDVMKPNMEL